MNQENTAAQPQTVKVTKADLPAYCPTESMGLWNSHPRVYIPFEDTTEASCPYCGTRFELVEQAD